MSIICKPASKPRTGIDTKTDISTISTSFLYYQNVNFDIEFWYTQLQEYAIICPLDSNVIFISHLKFGIGMYFHSNGNSSHTYAVSLRCL